MNTRPIHSFCSVRTSLPIKVLIASALIAWGWNGSIARSLQQDSRVDSRILTSEPKVFLGHFIANEKPAKHVFTITNEGPETVSLLELAKSCGCAKVSLATNRLKAGESTELSVVLDLRELGEKGSTIHLKTDSKLVPIVEFHIVYHVSRGLIAKPTTLEYDRVLPTVDEEFTVLLLKSEEWNPEDQWLKKIDVHPEELISAEIESDDDEFITLRVSFRSFEKQVELNGFGNVTLVGNDGNPLVSIPVSWKIHPRFEVKPESIVAIVDGDKAISKTLLVSSNRNEHVVVEKVEAHGLEHFRVEIVQINDGLVSLKISLMKVPGKVELPEQPFVEIRMLEPEPATIRIPVFFVGDYG